MIEKEFDYMNVIPLVDIMLVLLTIVLMTSTFVATGAIPINLPAVPNSGPGALKSQTIAIDADGKIFLNAAPTSLADLRPALAGMEKTSAVLIRADKTIALQSFVDVFDLVTDLGFTRIRLQTERHR